MLLQRAVAFRLLDRIQVFALEVLRRRHHRRRLGVGIDKRHAYLVPADSLRRTKAALAANKFVAASLVLADRRRLDEPAVLERLAKFGEFFFAELAARLVRRTLDFRDLKLQCRAAAICRRRERRHLQLRNFAAARKQSIKSTAETVDFLDGTAVALLGFLEKAIIRRSSH